ncbi:MAG: hypothetical protein JJ900_08105 [Rhodospirillales bacterium]|nr:hypothetical protein [Rhodospirillales bacterium]MBO6786800.1 hypothetical protein [Rhodospirillales bacterium]
MKPEDVYLREVLFEFHRVGSYMRVVAIDPRTNTEITMVGDPAVGEAALKEAAMRKLKYVIAKNHNERGDGSIVV